MKKSRRLWLRWLLGRGRPSGTKTMSLTCPSTTTPQLRRLTMLRMVLELIRCSIHTAATDMGRMMWPGRMSPRSPSSGGKKRSIQSSSRMRRLFNSLGISTTKSTRSPRMEQMLEGMMRTHPLTEKTWSKHSSWQTSVEIQNLLPNIVFN